MALITDPDDLSQGLDSTSIAVDTLTASGAQLTIAATATLPTIGAGDFFEIRDADNPANNGLYVETGGTPTSSQIVADKVDGTAPVTDGAENLRILHDNGALSEEKSVHIDTDQKRIYLIEQGNLSTDGVTLQALYSFLKEEWKNDADLIPFAFPMVAITPEQFEFSDGWEPRTVTSPAIQSKKLIRTGGWSEIDINSVLDKQYMGTITLGTFEDVADTAYYQFGTDATDTAAAVNFTFANAVNEAIKTYDNITPADPGTGFAITGNNAIARNDGGNWVTDGYVVGGGIRIANAEDPANDGFWTIATVGGGVNGTLTVTGTPLTNNAADTTMTAAVDNRQAIKLFLRIRDADPNGKTFDSSDLAAIGASSGVDNKVFRFPLANATDLDISATDATISGGGSDPYEEIRIRYLSEAYNREVDTTTKRNFGIVIDVGTYSQANGVSNGTTTFTSADWNAGTGEALADYAGGDLIIHEGTDQGTHTISGTPTAPGGTLTIVLTGALTGSETSLSFTMERATPKTATKTQIYEKIQWSLRQAADIDDTVNTVNGRTADELAVFVGPTLKLGSLLPTNPNLTSGGGVIIEGFDANDTNSYEFFDNSGTLRTFPFVAAGSISFNSNLENDPGTAKYWMFYTYTTRTNLTDGAVVGPSADTYDLESPGSNLPALNVGEYIAVSGFANSANNGIFVVTVVNVSTQDYTVRRVDGANVGAVESAVTIDVDENPIDSPDAIIVDNNSGADITGNISAASVNFDFDYDNNVQGGRTAATDAVVTLRAIGLNTGQFVETTGTITRAVGLSFSLVAGLERNYSNP